MKKMKKETIKVYTRFDWCVQLFNILLLLMVKLNIINFFIIIILYVDFYCIYVHVKKESYKKKKK